MTKREAGQHRWIISFIMLSLKCRDDQEPAGLGSGTEKMPRGWRGEGIEDSFNFSWRWALGQWHLNTGQRYSGTEISESWYCQFYIFIKLILSFPNLSLFFVLAGPLKLLKIWDRKFLPCTIQINALHAWSYITNKWTHEKNLDSSEIFHCSRTDKWVMGWSSISSPDSSFFHLS
jgi:hypothetical protein